jgi:hypothetical protein
MTEEAKKEKIVDAAKPTLWIITTVILAIALVASVAGSGITGNFLAGDNPNKAASNAINFINENVLAGQATAELINITEKNGLYLMAFTIGDQPYTSYLSKDGTMLFPQVIDMTAEPQAVAEPEAFDAPDAAKPKVELFVMSHCPYGTQAEKGILPVVELLGDKIDFSVKFVDYSMHGKIEMDEQTLQYCVQKDFGDKYTKYLACFLDKSNSTDCIIKSDLDTDALSKCINETDVKYNITVMYNDKDSWLSGTYPQFNINKIECDRYGVQGSPTLVINGETAPATGRDSATLLSTICTGFTTQPSECDETLSSAAPSAGFGYEGTDSSSGSCG